MISLEWVVTGFLLFGGMVAGAVSLYVKRKREEKMENMILLQDKEDFLHVDDLE